MAADNVGQESPARRFSNAPGETLSVGARVERSEPRRDLRCAGCGYGAVATPSVRCPMCGGQTWDFADWRLLPH
jgi:rubrerythrin